MMHTYAGTRTFVQVSARVQQALDLEAHRVVVGGHIAHGDGEGRALQDGPCACVRRGGSSSRQQQGQGAATACCCGGMPWPWPWPHIMQRWIA